MGFLSGIGKSLGFGSDDRVKNQIAPIDQRLVDVSREQADQAKQFRSQLPQYTQTKFQREQDVGKKNLGSALQGSRQGFGQRGLLYSGLRSGAEAGARGDMASQLAARRRGLTLEGEQQASGIEEQALQTGQGLADIRQQQSAMEGQINAARQQRKAGVLGNIGSSLGSLFGGAVGG